MARFLVLMIAGGEGTSDSRRTPDSKETWQVSLRAHLLGFKEIGPNSDLTVCVLNLSGINREKSENLNCRIRENTTYIESVKWKGFFSSRHSCVS